MKELNLKIKMKMRKKVMKKENLPETTRRKIVMMMMILRKLKMTNPLFRKCQPFQPGGRGEYGSLWSRN